MIVVYLGCMTLGQFLSLIGTCRALDHLHGYTVTVDVWWNDCLYWV